VPFVPQTIPLGSSATRKWRSRTQSGVRSGFCALLSSNHYLPNARITLEASLGRCWVWSSKPACGTLCRRWVRLPLASAIFASLGVVRAITSVGRHKVGVQVIQTFHNHLQFFVRLFVLHLCTAVGSGLLFGGAVRMTIRIKFDLAAWVTNRNPHNY
jgi:hypothetical protein